MKNSRNRVFLLIFPILFCFLSQGCDSLSRLTGLPIGNTPVPTLLSTLTSQPLISRSPSPTSTQLLTPTPCNRLAAGLPMDISIPDGSKIRPGENFTKVWRLVNTGSCTWKRDYRAIWFSGAQLTPGNSLNLNAVVEPGEYIDITVDMTAPSAAGIYQSNWILKAPDNTIFGLGPTGTSPFWVRIEVVDNRTSTPTPIPTLTSTPQKLPGGKVPLALNEWVDLDAPQVESSQPDLMLIQSPQQALELSPENNAAAVVFGEYIPTLKDCLNANVNPAPILLNELKDGIYLCYTTDLGSPGYARLTRFDPNIGTLYLEYFTWVIPDIKSTLQETKQ